MITYKKFPAWDPAVEALVISKLDEIRIALKPYFSNLTPEDRMSIFKLGMERESFVNDVLNATQSVPKVIPQSCDLNELNNNRAVHKGLSRIISYGSDIHEGLDDTRMIAGAQTLSSCNEIYKFFKIAANSNTPVNDIVKEMGQIYKKNGVRKHDTKMSISPGTVLELNGLKKESSVVNTGDTIVAIKCHTEFEGKRPGFDDVELLPGDSFKLPKGYSAIIIVNKSNDKEAEISVLYER